LSLRRGEHVGSRLLSAEINLHVNRLSVHRRAQLVLAQRASGPDLDAPIDLGSRVTEAERQPPLREHRVRLVARPNGAHDDHDPSRRQREQCCVGKLIGAVLGTQKDVRPDR